MPNIGGFISLIGLVPQKKTMTDFYEPVHFPITQYETAEERLSRSVEATKTIGQEYVINTFDLGVCMKALPLVCKYPDQYSKHIIFPGPFHTKMNFVSMPTKKKERESGCTEILTETKLVTSGKLVSALSRKAYPKALFNLKAVPKALERLLFEVFAEGNDTEIRPEALLNLINACSSSSCRDQLDKALQYESVTHITNKYEEFQIKVREGHLGKTAQF